MKIGLLKIIPAVFLVILAMLSCSLFNSPPTVSLTADDYTLYSDQKVTLTATGSDPNGDTLTYAWSINGVPQTATASTVTYTPLASTSRIDIINVVVTDIYSATASSSVNLTITAGASLHVVNSSTYTLINIYCAAHSNPTWGTDYLTSTLPPGSTFTLYGITPAGYYDARADSSSLTWETSAYTLWYSYGVPRIFTITNTNWTLGFNIVGNVVNNTEASTKDKNAVPAPSLEQIPSIGDQIGSDIQIEFAPAP